MIISALLLSAVLNLSPFGLLVAFLQVDSLYEWLWMVAAEEDSLDIIEEYVFY